MAMVLCALATPAAARASDFEHPASPDTSQQLSPLDVSGPGTTGVDLPGDAGTLVPSAVDEAGNRGIRVRVPYDLPGTPTPTPTPTAAPSTSTLALPDPGLLPHPRTRRARRRRGRGACTDTAAPTSLITGRPRPDSASCASLGTARDEGCAGLRRVSVSVARKVGKAPLPLPAPFGGLRAPAPLRAPALRARPRS